MIFLEKIESQVISEMVQSVILLENFESQVIDEMVQSMSLQCGPSKHVTLVYTGGLTINMYCYVCHPPIAIAASLLTISTSIITHKHSHKEQKVNGNKIK